MSNFDMSAKAGRDIIIKYLKDRMEIQGISSYALAKKSGVSKSTLSRFFNGEVDISLLNYLKLLGALEIRPYLVSKEDDPTTMNEINFN